MPKLKNSALVDYRRVLNGTRFTAEDFEITLHDTDMEEDEPLVAITFRAIAEFRFRIYYRSGSSYTMVREPGGTFAEEVDHVETLNDCLNYIKNWAFDIHDEIRSVDNLDEDIRQIREELWARLEQQVEKSSQFTAAEIDSIRSSLSDMAAKVESLGERLDLTEDEIRRLRDTISELLDDLETYPKYVWLRTALNKFLNVGIHISKSKEIRELAVNAAKSLLPGQGPN
jgi:cob(I)alamin adenosyltransferase